MPENNTATEAGNEAANGTGNGQAQDEPRFTQKQLNDFLSREKQEWQAKSAEKYADYDELKAKAAKLDELEAANKSELEKTQDALAKANESAAEWKARAEDFEAQMKRRAEIDEAAAEYGVSASMLARMTGDVTENARILADFSGNAPKYPNVPDAGETEPSGMTLEEIRGIKDPATRIRARAEYEAKHRKS